jgi:hypothetical protein
MEPLENPFYIPDLVLSAWLVAASLLRGRWLMPALLTGYGLASGVLGVATMTQAIAGHVGVGLLSGLLGSVAGMAIALCIVAWDRTNASSASRSSEDADDAK